MSRDLYSASLSYAGDNASSSDGGGPSCLVCIDHHLRSSTLAKPANKQASVQKPVPAAKKDDDEERGPFGKFWGC